MKRKIIYGPNNLAGFKTIPTLQRIFTIIMTYPNRNRRDFQLSSVNLYSKQTNTQIGFQNQNS